MLLAFPYMHPELFTGATVPGIRFLDPGMLDEPSEKMFRPDGLPMDKKTATALINDCINFGEQFKDPAEMAYFGAMTTEEFYEGSSLSIQSQLTQRFNDGVGGKEEREKKEAAARAQFVLLLAWFFEERMLEVASIEKGVRNSWKSMDETIGVDDEDRVDEGILNHATTESHTGGVSDGQSIQLPWKRTVEALPAFVPQDTVLVCTDKDIIAAWDDLEIAFSAADAKLGLPEGAQAATLPAWRFGGRRKEPIDLPLAQSEITIAIIR